MSENQLDIIGFTESHLKNNINDAEIEIQGFTMIRRDRADGYGGVLLYIRNCLNYVHRKDLEHDKIEGMSGTKGI